jgi:hypothetical protein
MPLSGPGSPSGGLYPRAKWADVAPARPFPPLIALEGASGIGKSRVARLLTAPGSGWAFLPEAYDRLRPPPALAVPTAEALLRVERRLFQEELTRYRHAGVLRRRGWTVVADTGFLGPLTYSLGLGELDPERDVVGPVRRWYESAARAGRVGFPDLTIRLTASGSTIRRRLAGDPTHHPPEWQRRHARVGDLERTLWEGPLRGRLGARLLEISGAGPPEAVAARIHRHLRRGTAPPPWSSREAARQLRAALPSLAIGKG